MGPAPLPRKARVTERPVPGRPRAARGVAAYSVLATGQAVSLLGSRMTSFVLGVWVYQQTGSATAFALIYFFATIPEILLAPVAGALADRWNRRTALILGDGGAAVVTLAVLALVWTGRLEVVHVYVLAGLSSACQSLQFPALTASITLLVPKRHLTRANGALHLGFAVASLAGPLLAGFALERIGLRGVVLLDLASFLFAAGALGLVRIPSHRAERAEPGRGSALLREAWDGWAYIRRRPGLLALLALFAASNFTLGVLQVSLTPLVLSFASPAVLGTVLSAAGGGVAAGSLAVTAWGGPRRNVRSILLLLAAQGGVLFLGGLRPRAALIAGAAFAFTFCTPVVYACSQSLWQRKVEPAIQGRVFAMRRMVAWSFFPLAYLSAGPLVDRVFTPLLLPDGALADSIGRWIGVGPGRGIGLLFMLLGCLVLAAVALGASYRPLRRLEEDLPDHVGEDVGESLADAGGSGLRGEA